MRSNNIEIIDERWRPLEGAHAIVPDDPSADKLGEESEEERGPKCTPPALVLSRLSGKALSRRIKMSRIIDRQHQQHAAHSLLLKLWFGGGRHQYYLSRPWGLEKKDTGKQLGAKHKEIIKAFVRTHAGSLLKAEYREGEDGRIMQLGDVQHVI